jgi:hypothetical protein
MGRELFLDPYGAKFASKTSTLSICLAVIQKNVWTAATLLHQFAAFATNQLKPY